jgi:hypothetical protein
MEHGSSYRKNPLMEKYLNTGSLGLYVEPIDNGLKNVRPGPGMLSRSLKKYGIDL